MAVWNTPHCPNAATACSAAYRAYDRANAEARVPPVMRAMARIKVGLRPRAFASCPKDTVPRTTPAKNTLWIKGAWKEL